MSENGSPHPTDVSPAAPTPMRTSHETTENMIPETPAEALSLQGRHWQAVATTTTETTSGTITRLPVPALTPHYASSLVRNVTTASVGALFGFASFSARPTSQQLTPVKRRRFDASLTDRKERDEVKGQKSARNAADSEEEADVPREDACGTKRNEAGAVSENNLIQPATNQSSAHRGMLPSSSSQEALKVFLRQRPSEPALPRAVHLSSANSVTFRPTVYNTGSGSVSASQEVEAVYSFDEVFAENAQDEMVFRKTTLPLLDRLMKSSTPMDELVLAYGPSGSGKTHTLTGILKKTIQFLVHEAGKLGTTAPGGVRPSKWSDVEILSSPHFQEEEDDSSEESVSLWISFLEIHNDKCRDLLNPESIKGKGHPLKYDPFTKTPFLKEMTEAPIKDFKSAQDLVARVIAARRTMETNVNKMSSRGHLITTIKVLRFCGQRGIKPRISRISIADLAGSENAKRTGAEGATQTEAGHINKSLYVRSSLLHLRKER
ncbi:P-loop containing nucleoside triphosphate hydrolase protein [Chytriomyces sp. MP71]|nr:P-loop containing nucleoside triphosphate hydrolase protein [Chytriomyces sp. MP71]